MTSRRKEDDRVIVVDTTLRGAPSGGSSLTPPASAELARQLTTLGVNVIEVGLPSASPERFLSVQAVARDFGNYGPVVCALARPTAADVDEAWNAIKDAARSRIHVFVGQDLDCGSEGLVGQVGAAVAHAKRYTDDVEFSPQAGADADLVVPLVQVALDEGATTIDLPDPAAQFGQPQEVSGRIAQLFERVPRLRHVVLSIDCGNALGGAVGNSLAGLVAGCRQVRCALHGFGGHEGGGALEAMGFRGRADSAALEVIAMNLHLDRHDELWTSIDMTEIVSTSDLVCRLKGYDLPPHQPIVGRNVLEPKPMYLVEEQFARADGDRALLIALGQPVPAWMAEWPSDSEPVDPVT